MAGQELLLKDLLDQRPDLKERLILVLSLPGPIARAMQDAPIEELRIVAAFTEQARKIKDRHPDWSGEKIREEADKALLAAAKP